MRKTFVPIIAGSILIIISLILLFFLDNGERDISLKKDEYIKTNELTEEALRAKAELVNYRRRKDEEVANTLKYANQDLITEIIPVVDNFERAINVDESKLTEELKNYLVGFKMMYENLKVILKNYGVEEINRVGQVFDPNLEQALLTEVREDLEDEVVIEVLQKGYKLKDRVIRPASVKINQK